MKKLLLTVCFIFTLDVIALENEDYYNRQFCTEESGQAEYRLPDLSNPYQQETSVLLSL